MASASGRIPKHHGFDKEGDEGDDHSDRTDSSKGVVERRGSMVSAAPGQVSNSTTDSDVTNGSELESNPAARSNYWNAWNGRRTHGRNFGYIGLMANSAALIKEAVSQIEALSVRDPCFVNSPDAQGRLLHIPSEVVLTIDGDKSNKCYLPAIQFCVGSKKVVRPAMKKLLSNVSYTQLEPVVNESRLTLVKQTFTDGESQQTMFLHILSKTAGMFMIGGKVGGHMHWAGLDCFKGVLYMGNGLIRILESSDLESRESAKAFFVDGGFVHVSEIYSVRKLSDKKRKHNE